jgi:hypothetical protein
MSGASAVPQEAGLSLSLLCGDPRRGRGPRTGVQAERSAHDELAVQAAH